MPNLLDNRYVVGIVGSEAAKFTPETEFLAKFEIRKILTQAILDHPGKAIVACSGKCHLGGIDIWTEEIALELGCSLSIFPPKNKQWSTGYRPRNIQIAAASDEVYCITVKSLPTSYTGMKFDHCYHCNTSDHVKSGGCWTMKYAARLGKKTKLIVIE